MPRRARCGSRSRTARSTRSITRPSTVRRPATWSCSLPDGETFLHEEKRDFEYDFHYIDPNALAVRVVANDLQGRYTVTKEFISDPHHPVVLMNVKIKGDESVISRLKCYALLAPHLDGGGAGNSARSIEVAGQRCILAWKKRRLAGDGRGLRLHA